MLLKILNTIICQYIYYVRDRISHAANKMNELSSLAKNSFKRQV